MRRREFGRIDRLPSGRYRARFTGPDDKRHAAPTTFATHRQAAGYLARVRADLMTGNTAAHLPSELTVGAYLSTYLDAAAARLRPRTLDLYRDLARRWVLCPVGNGAERVNLSDVPLGALSPSLVRTWHASVLAEAHRRAVAAVADRAVSPAASARAARAWAVGNGVAVAPTGRLPRAVLTGWDQAGRPGITVADPRDDAGRTVTAQAYRLLRSALSEAVTDGYLASNPCKVKGAGTVHHPERLPITPAQVSTLADAIGPRYRAAVLVAAWSGLRPGEVFALQRRDVDLDASTLTVRRTLVERSGHRPTFGPPKSDAGRRTVTLPRAAAAALAEHMSAHTGRDGQALIFTASTGGPVTAAARSRALRPAREAIERPDLTWHHLRHTGATLAAIAGATQAELQRRIGHSTTRAAAIYQHARDDRDQWIADQLDALATAPARPPHDPGASAHAPERPRGHLRLVRSA